MVSLGLESGLNKTAVRVLTALAGGDSVLILPHPTKADWFRCVLSSQPDAVSLVSYSLSMKLERRGFIEWAGEQELVITDAGREELAKQVVDPVAHAAELDLLDGLARPRVEQFVLIMQDLVLGYQDRAEELTPEVMRALEEEAAEHVRAGGHAEGFTRRHIPRGGSVPADSPDEDPVVLKSNSSPVAGNQFRKGSSLRRNYGRAKHKR